MTTYKYEGISESGAKIEGLVEAFDEQDAVAKARENCRQLLHVELVRNGKLNKVMNADIGDMLTGGKIKPKVLSLLCSQLSIELRAGLPLVSSLRLVAENEQDKKMKKMLEDVAADVHAGNSLADSFATHGKGLPNSFIESVRAGEEAGRLDESFDRMKKYYNDSAKVSARVSSAMVYPIMLIVVAVIVIIVLMVFAVPSFTNAFADMGAELPLPTKILIAVSNFMRTNLVLLLSIIAIIVLALALFKKTDKGKHFFAWVMLKLPGIKLVTAMKAAAQFSATLCTMMASGLPMVKSIQITAATMDNLLVSEDVAAASSGILEGNRLCDGLRKSKWLPNLLLEMTSVGEETGKLEETMNVVSDYYNQEVDTAVDRALEVLNPVITICLAFVVVFILLSVYLPILSMYNSV